LKDWDLNITPQSKLLKFNFREVWSYKDLVLMFVKKDVITTYKQTILGPLWFVIQPIMTLLVYVFVFGNIANISTDGLPQSLFYLSGIILWNYFSECFLQTSDTFLQNSEIFGKVYFPRIVIPISKSISGLLKFFIQFLLFIIIYCYYFFIDQNVSPNLHIVLVPLFVVILSGYGLGFGLLFSALTSKYRDLKFFLQFGVQLLMFSTPIIYPLSSLDGKILKIMQLNPFTHVFEAFKYAFLGKGFMSFSGLIYSTLLMLFVLIVGLIVFNKTEKNFMDTV
jgi:lipopolysaccharide transport system permease protein